MSWDAYICEIHDYIKHSQSSSERIKSLFEIKRVASNATTAIADHLRHTEPKLRNIDEHIESRVRYNEIRNRLAEHILSNVSPFQSDCGIHILDFTIIFRNNKKVRCPDNKGISDFLLELVAKNKIPRAIEMYEYIEDVGNYSYEGRVRFEDIILYLLGHIACEKDREKVYFPDYQGNYPPKNARSMTIEDVVGKIDEFHISRADPAPSKYPSEFIRDAHLPLETRGRVFMIENAGFWRNGFGSFNFEKFIIVFSDDINIHRIWLSVDDEKIRDFEIVKFERPPFPLVLCKEGDDYYYYEHDVHQPEIGTLYHRDAYTIEDLKSDVVRAIADFRPAFSAIEEENGCWDAYRERRRRVIEVIEKELLRR